MFFIVTATLELPKYHDLNHNPGLFPLKLGHAQIQTDYWTFIQIFDITDIINEFRVLKNKFSFVKKEMESSTLGHHSYRIVNILEDKVSTQIEQLNPSLIKRQKRGLVDGLGSIIKSITGNLDQRDAEKYDDIISKISNNQNKLETLFNKQMTILQSSIKNFNDNIQKLSDNQIRLNSKIEELESIINKTLIEYAETTNNALLQNVISQYTSSLQIIYDLLEKIEVAISFSKSNVFHNSIVEPNDLFSEIILLNKQLKTSRFPFKPTLENLLLFEKIITIKSYSKGNQITFLLQIPIVEAEYFNYYHLYSLPTPNHLSFKTIIPRSKFLISNEQTYAFFDSQCEETLPEEFLCRDVHVAQINEDAPCEVQLLNFNTNITNCVAVPADIPNIKIQKIEKNQWIVITPYSIAAVQKCGRNTNNIPLNGTYLIEINNECEVKIKDTILKTFQTSKTNFVNINLPNLPTTINQNNKDILNYTKIKLDTINLDETKNLISMIDNENIKLQKIEDQPIYYNKTSIYTVLLYTLIILIVLCCTFYYFVQKRKQRPSAQLQETIAMSANSVAKTPIVLH